jgi:hypothetical protein
MLTPILILFQNKGSFDEGVEYGLCLATNSQVVLLSIDFIRFTKGNGAVVNEMRFTPQPNYSISTDNIIINTIKSSRSTGRIFMGGADGSLYEFFYQVNLFTNQILPISFVLNYCRVKHSRGHIVSSSTINKLNFLFIRFLIKIKFFYIKF